MENHVRIGRSVHISDMRRIEHEINSLIEFRGYDRILVDFSSCSACFSETITPFVAYTLAKRDEGVQFSLKLPTDGKLSRLFVNCGWANLISPLEYRVAGTEVGENLPARRFINHTEQDGIIRSAIDRILKRMSLGLA